MQPYTDDSAQKTPNTRQLNTYVHSMATQHANKTLFIRSTSPLLIALYTYLKETHSLTKSTMLNICGVSSKRSDFNMDSSLWTYTHRCIGTGHGRNWSGAVLLNVLRRYWKYP